VLSDLLVYAAPCMQESWRTGTAHRHLRVLRTKAFIGQC